ncbi:MAG: XkdF-like putative serine protease domain-containing protein, partial [Lachnospiraceae bacterium]|nr:XkdF-like putative serine protease domain-containing protein [Lachnospiraceae bacterium]
MSRSFLDSLVAVKKDRDQEKPTGPFTIKKAVEDKMQVFGWASISETTDGKEISDWEGDMITPEDLERAAYSYVLNFRDA